MTHLSSEREKDEWEKEIDKIEKKVYYKDEAEKLYNHGETRNGEKVKLENGEIFRIRGAMVKKNDLEEMEAYSLGMFMNGKLIYGKFDPNDRRLKRLKRQLVASLIKSAKSGFVDTRQAPWLPRKYQSTKTFDVLWGADSIEGDLEKMKDKPTFKSKDEILSSL